MEANDSRKQIHRSIKLGDSTIDLCELATEGGLLLDLGEESIWITPDEARRIGRALEDMAATVETAMADLRMRDQLELTTVA